MLVVWSYPVEVKIFITTFRTQVSDLHTPAVHRTASCCCLLDEALRSFEPTCMKPFEYRVFASVYKIPHFQFLFDFCGKCLASTRDILSFFISHTFEGLDDLSSKFCKIKILVFLIVLNCVLKYYSIHEPSPSFHFIHLSLVLNSAFS